MEDKDFILCMERMKKGDKEALREIYEAYSGYIFHLILGILKNREDAEDVASEFFIKLWKLADTYEPGSGHRTYMGRIAHNMAIDYLRVNNREILLDQDEAEFAEQSELVSQEPAVEEQVIGNLSVQETLGRLKPSEQEIVHLKVIGQMTFEEISVITSSPMGTVTWRYREAMKKIRRCGFSA